jgi:parallel beta-helix repeat protein
MKCAECSTEMAAGSIFCSNCGAPLSSPNPPKPFTSDAESDLTMPSSPPLAGWLVVESGVSEGQQFPLRGTMRLGRSAENEIALVDSQLSRNHAAISREEGGYILQDLNSTNGTFLNGQSIAEPHVLRDGDQIRIGNTTLIFRWLPTAGAAPTENAQASPQTITAPWQPPPAWTPVLPQAEDARQPRGVPIGVVMLGAIVAVLVCGVIATGLYFFLGKPDLGLAFLGTQKTAPPAITQVVTSVPAEVVTHVVTNTPEPTPTILPTDTPIPGPVTVRVAPDGSGDYANLEAAVEAVPSGSTILLDTGTFQLEASLEISKSLSLRGAGMDETFITGTEGDEVVLFSGPGFFAAEGITFRYEGSLRARVVTVKDGEIDVVRCRFTGGIWNEEEEKGGDGLFLRGNTTGSVRESWFEGNELHGIELQDGSKPLLEGNVCMANGQNGICYWDESGGTARQNTCTQNGRHGIGVNEQAQPILEGNVCKDNEEIGIRFSDTAEGTASRNECTGNGLHGIVVRGEAQPTLEENTCRENQQSGIVYFESGGGLAIGNECTGNGLHGIGVEEQAQPTLEGNTCTGNVETGIVYFDQAGGVARQNRCTENGLHGIGVNGEAQPTLEDNTCENNAEVGIRFTDNSGGLVRRNTCTGNGLHGFQIKEQASPTLEGNTSSNNVEGGIIYMDSAGGAARQNVCIGNKWGIYVAETANPELMDNDCRNNSTADIDDRRVPP